MTERLYRHQRKLNRQADRDPLAVRLVSVRDAVFPRACAACGASDTIPITLVKHCRFTVHSDDGPSVQQRVARLPVFLCSACAERHRMELGRSDRSSDGDTSVSRTIEYVVNPDTESLVPSAEPAWHGFRFRTPDYAARFRELNAERMWSVKRYARETADARRSDLLGLALLIGFAAALALWAYLRR